jgi:lysyl-tRNA synthetase, class I
LKPPKYPEAHVPFEFLVQQGSLFPINERTEKVYQRLVKYNMVKEKTPGLVKRIILASNWIEDKISDTRQGFDRSLGVDEKKAVSQLIEGLQSFRNLEKDPETPKMLQSKIFEIARSNFLEPKNFFKLIYRLLLNTDTGPRLGNYAVDLGIEKTCEILSKHLDHP